jgi:hypothetical protein
MVQHRESRLYDRHSALRSLLAILGRDGLIDGLDELPYRSQRRMFALVDRADYINEQI